MVASVQTRPAFAVEPPPPCHGKLAGRAGDRYDHFSMRRACVRGGLAALAVMAAACGGPGRVTTDEGAAAAIVDGPARRRGERAYALRWGGAPLGWARERDDGQRWQRREQVVVRRGDAVVASELELTIDRDADGAPRTIELARWQDGPVLRGRATALPGGRGWRVDVDGEPPIELPPAVPFELALLEAPARGGFRGRVLLAGYGFAIAELDVARAGGDGAWRATLAIAGRPLVASVRYADDGRLQEIRGADGVVAVAVDPLALAPPSAPIEVVGGSALAVEGLAPGAAAPAGVWLPRADGPPPPPLPGQRVDVLPDVDGWVIHFDADAPAALPAGPGGDDRTPALRALARQVADEVEDDLGATALTEGGARLARRGDCTTHALRFAALAADRGVETRVVTGLRLDGGALVRHRWVIAWTGRRWLAIDPTYAEAPAAPVLVGLAVHRARAADLALADAVVFDHTGDRALAIP
jgi:hypothetical protein